MTRDTAPADLVSTITICTTSLPEVKNPAKNPSSTCLGALEAFAIVTEVEDDMVAVDAVRECDRG